MLKAIVNKTKPIHIPKKDNYTVTELAIFKLCPRMYYHRQTEENSCFTSRLQLHFYAEAIMYCDLLRRFIDYNGYLKRRKSSNENIIVTMSFTPIDEMGTLISPHYLTASFPKLLEKNNLRHIRFHDLRHSCASLLLANGVPMKQIQEWLGHSDFSTTANVYAHLDYNSKLSSADAMVNGLSVALEVIS